MDGRVVADESGVTLQFSGVATDQAKKAASPRTLPWGSIASVTFTPRKGLTPAHMRVNLHGEARERPKARQDPNVLLANSTTEVRAVRLFVEQVSTLFQGLVRQSLEDIPLERITSVRSKAGVLLGTLTVLASNTELVIKNVNKPDLVVLAGALRMRIATGALPVLAPLDDSPEEPLAGVDGGENVLDHLRQLGELHESGVLTAAEFQTAKAELLKRL